MHATAVWVSLFSGVAALPQLRGLPLLGAAPLPVSPLTNTLSSVGSVAAPLTDPFGSVSSVAASLSGVAPVAGLTAPLSAVAPVLSSLSAQAPSTYSVSGAIYLGFFISFQSIQVPNLLGVTNTIIQQLLTGSVIALPNLTWQTCSAYCASNGFRYAGVEGGNTCRCGSAFAFTPVRALDTVCGLTCSGSTSECCGALNRLVLFQILSPATISSSQPAASTTPRPSPAVSTPVAGTRGPGTGGLLNGLPALPALPSLAPVPAPAPLPGSPSNAPSRPVPASSQAAVSSRSAVVAPTRNRPSTSTVPSSSATVRPTLISSVPPVRSSTPAPLPASIRPSALPVATPVPLPSPIPAPASVGGLPNIPLPSLSVVPAILREINSADVCIARLPAAVRQAILTSCFS